jgi:hypothetical protein
MSKVIICPNCGQKNRINESPDSLQAICAKCWTKLNVSKKAAQPPPPPKEPYTPPPIKNENTKSSGLHYGWVWVLVIVFVVCGFLWWIGTQDSNDSTSKKSSTTYSKSKPVPSYPEVVMPYNGAIQIYTNGKRVAPFEIQTSRGSNYLVKLVSAYSQEPMMTIFIKGGNTVSTEVPLGTYEVKYASGEKWYGDERLFGPETDYSKAETLFTFKNNGNQINGYTIILYSVANGNLRTSSISPSQF